MEVSILGELEIRNDEGTPIWPGHRRPHPLIRALICVLALQDRPWPGAQLKALLWDDDERDLTSRWTSLIYRARQVLPPGRLVTEPGRGGVPHYSLRRGAGDSVDVDRFRDLMRRAERAGDVGDLQAARSHYRKALALWRTGDAGPLLPDFPVTYVMQQHPDYIRLLHQYRDAAEAYAELCLDLGQYGLELADELCEFLTHLPVNIKLHRLRMLTLCRAGRKGEALAAYREALTSFQWHVGAAPGPELDQLRDQIVCDDPRLAPC